jgi:chorismate synthase
LKTEVKASANVFGNYFQVATYGESHGGGVGCVISGCPPRIPLTEADMQVELDRRRPGQSRITTPRKETDTCKILSGTHEGMVSFRTWDKLGKNIFEFRVLACLIFTISLMGFLQE